MTGKEDGKKVEEDTSRMKEIGSTTHFQCPMLKGANYTTWAIRMQVILEANGLWEMIEPELTTEIDTKKDKTAVAYLYQSLPEDQLLHISKYKTAKAVWDALKTRHVGVNRVQQAKQQTLKSEFEMLQMKDNESIDSFITKITSIINNAASVGLTYDDPTIVRKLLNAVPDRFLQIVASIEQYSNLDEMSLDEAIRRLKTFEERLKCKRDKQENNQESLLFTQQDNRSQQFRRQGRGKFNQNHGNFTSKRNWEQNSPHNSSKKSDKSKKFDINKIQCYKCIKYGHYSSECPQNNREKEQSNLIEEDLEPTLLLSVSNINKDSTRNEDYCFAKSFRDKEPRMGRKSKIKEEENKQGISQDEIKSQDSSSA